jgi:hypothetical protein
MGVLPSVNIILLSCDLHWDVTGITKVIRPHCPLPSFTMNAAPMFSVDHAGVARALNV